jgi:ABC-type molybdate transport system substrate-binding protein
MKSCRSRIAFAVAALALVVAGIADAADLKVYSSLVFGEIWAELKPKIEARGHKLELVLLPSGAVTKRVTEGEAVDVIVTTAPAIDGLAKSGKLAPDTTRAVASVGIGVAVLKGAPRPDISTPEAFRNALLAAKSVAYSDPAGGGASGIAFAKVLKDLGIAEAVNAKASSAAACPTPNSLSRVSRARRPADSGTDDGVGRGRHSVPARVAGRHAVRNGSARDERESRLRQRRWSIYSCRRNARAAQGARIRRKSIGNLRGNDVNSPDGRHPLRCKCGTVRGYVAYGANTANRGVCYCKDCQAFARFLGDTATSWTIWAARTWSLRFPGT